MKTWQIGILSFVLGGAIAWWATRALSEAAQNSVQFIPLIALESVDLPVSDHSAANFQCTLSDSDLQDRKSEIRANLLTHVQTVEELSNGYRLYFRNADKIDARIFEFILAERECCPFFKFELSMAAFNQGIRLDVTGLPGVKFFLKPLFEEWLS